MALRFELRSLSVDLTRDALEGLRDGSDPADLFVEHSELRNSRRLIYDLCSAIDVHRFAHRSAGTELRLVCRDGLLKFTIPALEPCGETTTVPALASPALVHGGVHADPASGVLATPVRARLPGAAETAAAAAAAAPESMGETHEHAPSTPHTDSVSGFARVTRGPSKRKR